MSMVRLWIFLFLTGSLLFGCSKGGGGSGNSGSSAPAPGTETGGGGSDLPPGLPTHFGFGLANFDRTWLTASGSPWDYRYQYLAGGVNTGAGWATWNSPAGQYAATYMTNSAAVNTIPVFSYYMLVQSNPDPGNEDPDSKLQNASTMNAYFADWKLLMQKCGAFGRPVIVHHEPDLWGYLQQQNGDDPTVIPVAVTSSGFAEAAGYENTARGFAKVLSVLRNTYAPNALLGWHASLWATNLSPLSSYGNPTTLGNRVASFFNALDANFNLIFFDVADRDAGQSQSQGNSTAWWNDTSFDRCRQWMVALSQSTGRKTVLWQTPMGNTLYRTCDNTNGHYQDNRAQYFLLPSNRPHLVDYANAGLIAVLFGGGVSGATSCTDRMGDGITNPAPINGNDLVSAHPDDDGGFLRLNVYDYYHGTPLSLP